MTILDFSARKANRQKISMLTCYDATFARLLDSSRVDCILIGDSCSMVMHGEKTTIPATIEMLETHTKAVRSGTGKFILSDMPFLSTRKGIPYAAECAGRLLVAGANAVKIEGVYGQEDVIRHLVQSGIPVMSHLGLTPQFYNALGGHKKQGKTDEAQKRLSDEAVLAESLGCFGILLECIPSDLAKRITESAGVPTIGIGAGKDCDGQVLVLQDMLGMSGFKPKFVREYLQGASLITDAFNRYAAEVSDGVFPAEENGGK